MGSQKGSSKKGSARKHVAEEPRDVTGQDALVEELRSHRAALMRINDQLVELASSRDALQEQLEVLIAAQRRTSSLLELALGSAFDLEIDGFERRR